MCQFKIQSFSVRRTLRFRNRGKEARRNAIPSPASPVAKGRRLPGQEEFAPKRGLSTMTISFKNLEDKFKKTLAFVFFWE
jgi:hypothetical protein